MKVKTIGCFSEKCEIIKNEILGRNDIFSYVVATNDIQPGEEILSELPITVTPQWDSRPKCDNCFQESLMMCEQCQIFPLCVNCTKHDDFDCNFFKNHENLSKNFLIDNYGIYGILKCFLLMENPETEMLVKNIFTMESHLEKRRNSEIWNEHKQNIVEPILNSGIVEYFKKFTIDEELIQTISSIIDVNSFEIRNGGGDSIRGIFVSAALLAHDCTANTMIAVDNDFKMKIIATVPIKAGDMITNCYTNSLMGTNARRHHLKIGKYFDCKCKRCEDPTELGTNMSTLRCINCSDGYVIFQSENWTCINCNTVRDTNEVNQMLADAHEDVIEADGDIRKLEMLIAKFSEIFHTNHYLIIDLKQNVAAILRTICMNSLFRPGKMVFERKIQLCEDILPILKVIQPGISRLCAIAIYEYFVPYAELAEIQYENKEITVDDYMNKLKKSEELARESAKMLFYEPTNSPEGQLAKHILGELKRIRDNMKGIANLIKKP